MKVLAIETSCDETAAAVVEKNQNEQVIVWGETVASSEDIHIQTGGIVPEVAAREQLVSIMPVIETCLISSYSKINHKKSIPIQVEHKKLLDWAKVNVDAIAVTQGPGLIGSLLVGVETAKSLALAWNKPLIPVNHILGHIYANWIEDSPKHEISSSSYTQIQKANVPEFPLLALIVSGGHTELVLMKNHQDYQIVGGTLDDAAGECFDKCARALDLPYPGGPNIASLAAKFGIPNSKFEKILPRPLLHDDTFDMSFSGLKAAFVREANQLKQVEKLNQEKKQKLAYDLEQAIAEVLVKKVSLAIETCNPKSFLLAGGVAANQTLRQTLEDKLVSYSIQIYKPAIKYCVDNAAMIGAAALFHSHNVDPLQVKANPGLQLWD